jgi:hypothetical protein
MDMIICVVVNSDIELIQVHVVLVILLVDHVSDLLNMIVLLVLKLQEYIINSDNVLVDGVTWNHLMVNVLKIQASMKFQNQNFV